MFGIQNKIESPWGPKRPSSNNGNELDELLRNSQEKIQKVLRDGKKGGGKFFVLVIIAVILVWLSSGFYNVEQGEHAVVLRFGKFVRLAMPGLNYHLPDPVEKVIKQRVERIESEEIGSRSAAQQLDGVYFQRNATRQVPEESLMLTGDENLVDVNFIVQWKIRDIKQYIFNVLKPRDAVKSAAESAMRDVIGNTPIVVAQTEGRSVVENRVMELLQNMLDIYQAGIEVVNVRLLKVEPPIEVIDAFRDVQTARADKEREINQAQAYQNDIMPRARGEAAMILQEAEAYKQQVIAVATGEVSRFTALYKQYQNAQQLTRKRLYIEAMESILQNTNKIILDGNIDKNVVPYLPLGPAMKTNNTASAQ
ncbi:MAG: FtsH protease activity modulator HflK [Rickettsiales endosymbiont of Dermacentor nuttalli]